MFPYVLRALFISFACLFGYNGLFKSHNEGRVSWIPKKKGIHRLEWCLRVFMDLGSLSLLYSPLTFFFSILPAFAKLLKTFAFKS
jgi:hypothetical protein